MDMHMIHPAARKELREIKGIARAQFRLHAWPIFLLVLRNERGRPFECGAASFCIFFPDPQNLLGRRVVNWGAQPADVFMAQTSEWRIHRADYELDAAPFQRQHFRVAKRLRDYGETGVKITEPH